MKILSVDYLNDDLLTINIIEKLDDGNTLVLDSICKEGSMDRESLVDLCKTLANINNCCQIFINDRVVETESA